MTSRFEIENPTAHVTEVRVRYCEVDRMGYLHHSRYLALMELARTEALREAGFVYRDLEDMGALLVVAKVDIRYRAPAYYDDVLRIETTLRRVTWTRLDHDYRIVRAHDGVVSAEAHTTLGCVGPDGRPRKLPDELLQFRDKMTGQTAT
jgi:acyl-CoA thioester hydrolase